jgi:hypothetical protein
MRADRVPSTVWCALTGVRRSLMTTALDTAEQPSAPTRQGLNLFLAYAAAAEVTMLAHVDRELLCA